MPMKDALAQCDARDLEIVSGQGSHLKDAEEKEYLDFTAGWCVASIGYGRKEIVEAQQKFAAENSYVSPMFRFPPAEEFAEELLKITPLRDPGSVYRATSGSEAVEYAIQCARSATKRPLTISVDEVYHGHTYGAAAVGVGWSERLGPNLQGFEKIAMPRTEKEAEDSVKALEEILSQHEGKVAAFMSEPVWTNAGAIIPPKNFYPEVQKICRARDVLFIMDEVATGFGRCGTLFASEIWNLKPDIMCIAKGFTGGYASMAATLVSGDLAKRAKGVQDYDTFGWLGTDLIATRAVVEIIQKEKLAENAARIGKILLEELQPLKNVKGVEDVRGIGLLIGIDVDPRKASRMIDECQERGLLIEVCRGKTLFLTPPLVLTEEEAKEGAAILREVIENAN